ncbi:hypothetical protein N9134_00650 [Akkermansiaceae bacterium]|nr:hypothetical protein [Akkermansiaceae bacterium]MDB4277071.1 hypothetical protein [bacterium]MDA7629581.1 hypothetical protein [Akkermansiaceae bacterium]MDA7675225.1 hypothetical protein [Akkermansiaceae bacterium]MDA8967381.1 hypothetical protein [Akkermansiaceae bacterium]
MRWIIALLLAASLSTTLHAMGKKPPKNRITCHMQGHQSEGPKMVYPQALYGKTIFFRRSPELFTKDIIAFEPFVADDGSIGATFFLSKVAQRRFAGVTTQNQRSWFIVMLNGRPTDAMMVDKPVTDGKVVVWQGIQRAEVAQFDLMMPRAGDSKEQWKLRKEVVKEKMKKQAKKVKK